MRRIAQISDIHFGADDPQGVEALRRDLNAHPHDLLIVSGDLTQRARVGQFKAAMDFLKTVPGPQLIVPGNHDIPLWNWLRRFFSPLGRYKRIVTSDLRPVFRDAQLLVIGLNTARPFSWRWGGFWKDGRISADQLLDVHIACAESPRELFKVVVTHHPFIPPPDARSHGQVEIETDAQPEVDGQTVHGGKRAMRSLDAVGVELLLAGHLHMNYAGDVRTHYEATRRSILSAQAGTACSHRRRGEPNAYNRFTIETASIDGVPCDRLTLEVRALLEGEFTTTATQCFERRDGVWVDAHNPATPTDENRAATDDESVG